MKKKGVLLLIAVAAVVLYTMVYWGCSDGAKNKGRGLSSLLKEERDCEAEYKAIAERDYFYSTASAINECDSFLAHFQYQQCVHCEDVREMRNAFREMGDLFQQQFYSYEKYKTESRYVGKRMEASPYSVVRGTWEYLLHEEDSLRLRDALASLTEHEFQVYLHDYAQQVCQEKYGRKRLGLQPKSMKPSRMSHPTLVEGKAAVACSAEYDVKLEGPLGIHTRTDHLTVSGELSYTSEGKLIFHPTGKNIQ